MLIVAETIYIHDYKKTNVMKGKENKKESKKAKADGKTTKVQSDYQKEKTSKSIPDLNVFNLSKK